MHILSLASSLFFVFFKFLVNLHVTFASAIICQ